MTQTLMGRPRVWLAAGALAAVVVLVGSIAWVSRTAPGVDSASESIATPVDVAMAFIEARDAHDLETTRTLLAPGAVINDTVRSLEGYEVEFQIDEILGWQLTVDQCVERSLGPPVEIRCDYTHDTAWSRALGHESLPGGTFTFDIQDGQILKVTHFFNTGGLTDLAWKPFVWWVRDTHPDRFESVFTDNTGQALRRTPEALALLEELSSEFIAQAGEAGLDGEPAVVFDGGSCSYTGPVQFVGPSVIRVAFSNNSDALANIGVWSVAEGTDLEDVDLQATYQSLPGDLQNVRWQVPAGEEVTLQVAVAPGPHMFNCFVHARDATESAPALQHPVFFEVVDG